MRVGNKRFNVIVILAFLTALEPLSIDLYLPGFLELEKHFRTDTAAVQMSLSVFLGGFALGQLLWGPLSDKFGRKVPLSISLLVFICASLGCIYVKDIEHLWIMRFIQAIGGCGGIVISRAIVTDYFKKTETLSIFAMLALIMGVAPIIAPLVGNSILKILGWKGLFETMSLLGGIGLLATIFILPETLNKAAKQSVRSNIWYNYKTILKSRTFIKYSLIAGIVNGALMIYIGSAPFLIMDKGGLSENYFSAIFAINALGLMVSSYLTSVIQKDIGTHKIIVIAIFMMIAASILFSFAVLIDLNVAYLLIILFFYVFPMGMLFPTTTDLAMSPFIGENSGAASSLFGTIQLSLAFLFSVSSTALSDGSTITTGIVFTICALSAFAVIALGKIKIQSRLT